jgi:hypothetical protein
MDDNDNDIPLHLPPDEDGAIEAELGQMVLTFTANLLRERFPEQSHRPNCPNCITSLFWGALRNMLEDDSYAPIQKLQAMTSICDMVGPSMVALRVQVALANGVVPDISDVLYLAQNGWLTAEVMTPDEIPPELREQMLAAGISWVAPEPRKYDA